MEPLIVSLDERLANPGDTWTLAGHLDEPSYELGDHEFRLPSGIDYDLVLTNAGEGILIPAEILEHAAQGCRAFVILQPFGCLPNHVVGRGLIRALKERYPDAQILPLDYDPDVSFANVENRLQMLIMNARAAASAS